VGRLPDFIIIGAMKAATTTLHDQLAAQPGLFMSEPKEPYFFSDDPVYARGLAWYESLFDGVAENDLCGESSTHYTKLPTYPRTVQRMRQHLPTVKLIYVMRHPVDRLVSQFIHEWSQRAVPDDINETVRTHRRLVDYSLYTMQLEPYLEAYGPDNVLPVFFDRLMAEPQAELERICTFIGYHGVPRWSEELERRNASSRRLRKSGLRDAIVWNPAVTYLRRRFVPQRWRDGVKALWQMRQRPVLHEDLLRRIREEFDDDLEKLGTWIGAGKLSCENFKAVTRVRPYSLSGLSATACS
jgi:hypothetical protein